MSLLNTFIHNEEGAITVDWVVLSAAIVGLALGGVAAMRISVLSIASATNASMDSVNPSVNP